MIGVLLVCISTGETYPSGASSSSEAFLVCNVMAEPVS